MPESAPSPTKAADVMTPDPRTCSTFSTVLEAVLIFRDADCGAVPVLDDGKPVGVITDRDVALAVADYPDLSRQPVSAIMSHGVVTAKPDDSLASVIETIGDQRVRRILVVDAQDHLVGIIGWADIAPHVSNRGLGHVVTEVVEQA
jgi:CBS domain-containing protein